MKRAAVVHFSGGLRFADGRRTMIYLAGWPCCCSGQRAYKLAGAEGACSRNSKSVTCKTCLGIMARARCTTCTPNIPPHARGESCDFVYPNAPGSLCFLCDGTHEHEHRGRQS